LAEPRSLIEGKYEILGTIQDSEANAIYKVRHLHLDEVRVIKVLRSQSGASDEQARRFLQEAKTLTRLKHPNICTILDLFQDPQGTAYIVLEYIDGVNVSELLETSGLPSLPLALEIAHQTLLALECLHRRNIAHRDVAPDNIMLTMDENHEPHVKLIGLGVAKMLSSTVEITSSESFVGKMKYSSPEQLGALEEGEMLDGRSDLYSLGVVLYQILTGILPIRGEQPRQILVGHLFLPPIPFVKSDPEGKVPQEVAEIVLKALEKRREKRYSSAEEFDNEVVSVKDRLVRPADAETTRPLTISEAWRTPSVSSVIRPVSAALKRDSVRRTTQVAVPFPAAPQPGPPFPVEPTPPGKPTQPESTLVVKTTVPVTSAEIPVTAPAMSPSSATWRRRRLRLAIGGTAAFVIAIGAFLLFLLPRSKPAPRSRRSAPPATSPVVAPASNPEPKAPPAPEPPGSSAGEVPTPASAPLVPAAEEARSRMAAARSAAEAEGAPVRAPNTYRRARQKETEAQGLFERQESTLPEAGFVAAEQLFRKARESAAQWKRETQLAAKRQLSASLTPIGPVLATGLAPPEPKPVATASPIILQAPVLLREVGPNYPASGTLPPGTDEIVIVVEAVVTERGDVRDAQVPNVQHVVLDRAAMSAVSTWRFRPATVNGNPVAVRIKVTSVVRRTRNLLGNRLKAVSRKVETIGLATPGPSQADE
jgi:serine/threonine-protein kinase